MWMEKVKEDQAKEDQARNGCSVDVTSGEQTPPGPCGFRRPCEDGSNSERGASDSGTSARKKPRIITNGVGSPDFNSVS